MKNIDEIINITEELVEVQADNSFKSLEKAILKASLSQEKKTYAQIAHEYNYAESYIKHIVAPKLWKLLSRLLGEKINRSNCQAKLIKLIANQKQTEHQSTTNLKKNLQIADFKQKNNFILEKPEGQVPLDSSLYVKRSEIEISCYQELLQPITFIRITSPHKTGKTSLLSRIIQYAEAQDFYTVNLSLNLVESEILDSTAKFMRWLCSNIIYQLNLKSELDIYWQEDLGILVSSTLVLQECVLKKIDKPLVLAIDEVNKLYEQSTLSHNFFALLRHWHEKSKNHPLWQKLKPIIVYSTNINFLLNIKYSPFNIGLIVKLYPFSLPEIKDLIQRHQLQFSEIEIQKLKNLTGGHPYLLRLALYHLKKDNLNLEQILSNIDKEAEIYQKHLEKQLWFLEKEDILSKSFFKLIEKDVPMKLDREIAVKLHSLGLINIRGNEAKVSCELYKKYFLKYCDRLVTNN